VSSVVVGGSFACLAQSFPQQAPHSAHEFRRAAQGLSSLEILVDWRFCCLSEAEMEIFVMSTNDLESSSSSVDPTASKPAATKHPAPSMIWMLLPVALLALLAYLSR